MQEAREMGLNEFGLDLVLEDVIVDFVKARRGFYF